MPSDPEPELVIAAIAAIKLASKDGAQHPSYHYLQPQVTQADRVEHAAEHLRRWQIVRALGEQGSDADTPAGFIDDQNDLEHALADIAIVLARRDAGLP